MLQGFSDGDLGALCAMFGVELVGLLMEAQVGDASNLLEVRRDFPIRGSVDRST